MNVSRLYVGTYTRPAAYLAETNGNGLYVLDFDAESGGLTMRQEMTGIENPSYLAISPDGRNLHAAWEIYDWPEGLISSYSIDPSSGELTYLGVQGSRGSMACYLMMDSQSRVAFVANYWSGSVAMFPSRDDGALREAISVDQHEGGGPNAARQEGPHAHCIVVTADDRHAFSADLGTDTIYGYRIDYEARELVPTSSVSVKAGAGPRHMVFSPDEKHAFVICELDSTILALAWDAASAVLTPGPSYSMLPPGFEGESHCADIQVHPSGRFVYGSNRGHDSIAMFSIDAATGHLTSLGHRDSEGATPRNFAISPDGRFMLVANQDSDSVVTIEIDQDSGLLGETVSVAEVPTPVCLKFGR